MQEEFTEYEKQKAQKKRELVRNELQTVGKYQLPLIKKQEIDFNTISLISYVDTKMNDEKNTYKTVHFFTHDWLFDKVYDRAFDEAEKLKQYYALLSPDFSMFTDMPLALQIASVFKNHWCGAYWQSLGLTVIPTVSWGDERSFEFCFDGLEKGSAVAVCTYYRENDEESFKLGYNRMLEVIQPSKILCYDEPFKAMKGNIKDFFPRRTSGRKASIGRKKQNFFSRSTRNSDPTQWHTAYAISVVCYNTLIRI